VLHRFAPDGEHLGTEARCGGTTAGGQGEAIDRARQELCEMLRTLGPHRLCDVRVRPFGVESDGDLFGLIYTGEAGDAPEGPAEFEEWVKLEPNDVMFHPPWQGGRYST
jgi:hypothetical protein